MAKIETQEELGRVNEALCLTIKLIDISRIKKLTSDDQDEDERIGDRLFRIWSDILNDFVYENPDAELLMCEETKKFKQFTETATPVIVAPEFKSHCPWCGKIGDFTEFIADKNHT